MASPHSLAPGVRAVIGLAVLALPTRQDRSRYLDEFLGDLSGQSAAEQRRYAVGVLGQALALRAALRADPSRLVESPTVRSRWRSIRCHVLRIHYWKVFSTDDGSRYSACAVCRKESPTDTGGGPGTMAGLLPGM